MNSYMCQIIHAANKPRYSWGTSSENSVAVDGGSVYKARNTCQNEPGDIRRCLFLAAYTLLFLFSKCILRLGRIFNAPGTMLNLADLSKPAGKLALPGMDNRCPPSVSISTTSTQADARCRDTRRHGGIKWTVISVYFVAELVCPLERQLWTNLI